MKQSWYESPLDKLDCFLLCMKYLIKGVVRKVGAKCFNPYKFEKDVLILGNAPSLRDVDFSKFDLDNMYVGCVNFFPTKSDLYWKIRPKYIFLLDPSLFDFSNIEVKELWKCLSESTWKIVVITFYDSVINCNIGDNITIERIPKERISYEHFKRFRYFLYRKRYAIPGAQDVIGGALYYFIMHRPNIIYMAGVDLSEFVYFRVDKDNIVYAEVEYSYGKQKYIYEYEQPGRFFYRLDLIKKMFEEMYYLSKFSKDRGVTIYNLSINSYVDVFKKTDKYNFSTKNDDKS